MYYRQSSVLSCVRMALALPNSQFIMSTDKAHHAPPDPEPISLSTPPSTSCTQQRYRCLHARSESKWHWMNDSCFKSGLSSWWLSTGWSYPQAFGDGKRVLFGTNILDCGEYKLLDGACTPERTRIYPVRWNTSPDGTGNGGVIRELRLHPDDIHLGFNAFTTNGLKTGQYAYLGRLKFNAKPRAGIPLVPRYDLVKVTRLFNPEADQPIATHGKHITINRDAIAVGELRGFSGRRTEATSIGYPAESSNIDVFAVHLQTGKVRRLDSDPEYCDPMAISPDDTWMAVLDTRGTDRQMWLSGMRHIPPITDLSSTTITSSEIMDRGDSSDCVSCTVMVIVENTLTRRSMGKERVLLVVAIIIDPRWSPDGTRIIYAEAQTLPPACGGTNSLPCYSSKEPGGRRLRVVLATLTTREPLNLPAVDPISDEVPWGVKYCPGTLIQSVPSRHLANTH